MSTTCKACNGTRCIYSGPIGEPPSECEACFDQEPAETTGPLTYTVDGVTMSPLEYIEHLHTQLTASATPERYTCMGKGGDYELILPPLPAPSARLYKQNGYRRASVLPGPGDALYTAEQVRQAQRDAYELGQQSQKDAP